MGRKGSEPEGRAVAYARFRYNLAFFVRSREARADMWQSFVNLWAEGHREDGSASPKVSGKAAMIAAILLFVASLFAAVAVLAWYGLIPNWKT